MGEIKEKERRHETVDRKQEQVASDWERTNYKHIKYSIQFYRQLTLKRCSFKLKVNECIIESWGLSHGNYFSLTFKW